MKANYLVLAALILSGCSLEEVTQYGETCPPRSASDASLSFIGTPSCNAETPEACKNLTPSISDAQEYFQYKNCPSEYNKCIANANDGNYHCEKEINCAAGQFQCRDNDETICLDPMNNKTCGATGCDNRGVNCESGGGTCSSGVCMCSSPAIWCSLDGDDQSRCMDPSKPETCNARLSDAENSKCVIEQCADNELCRINNEHNGYECGLDTCAGDTTNCGTEANLKCVNLKTDRNNCGECGNSCLQGQRCVDSNCEDVKCQENQCQVSDGDEPCVNTDDHCGPDCNDCTTSFTGYCESGTCYVHNCEDNKHPVYEGTRILQCEKNTDEICAPKDMSNSETPKDCTQNVAEHALSNTCSDEGKCIVKECETGYHLSADKTACEPTSDTACATTTSADAKDCTAIDPGTTLSANCKEGVCKVNQCAQNFHLSPDETRCEPNTDSACSKQNSAVTTDCTALPNVESAICTSAGTCEISACKSGFHPSSNKSECEATSQDKCQLTDGSIVNCDEKITHSAVTKCEASACKAVKCQQGYHLSDDNASCVENKPESCASVDSSSTTNCNDAINHSSKTECQNGTCLVTACQSGFHPDSSQKSCNTDTQTECTRSDGNVINCNEQIPTAAVTACQSQKCTVVECKPDHHPSSTKDNCVPNSDSNCAAVDSPQVSNCLTLANVNAASCKSGTCIVTTCDPDYHLNSTKTGCTQNSTTSCAAVNMASTTDCTKLPNIASASSVSCTNGACIISQCAAGNHLNDAKTACVANSQTSCGTTTGTGKTCMTTGVKTASCTAAGACSVSECNAGYHLNDAKNACVANSQTSCGTVTGTGKTCVTTGVKTASCTSAGACSVSECNAGYHLNDAKNACVANSQTSCGTVTGTGKTCMTTGVKTASCSTTGACSVSECNAGYHLNDAKTACVANSTTSCGTTTGTGTSCTSTGVKTATCTTAGVCSVTECNSAYHLNDAKTACVANSSTSCGTVTGTGKSCMTTGVKTASCTTAGACTVSECNSGYHLNDAKTACVANSSTSCGTVTGTGKSCMTANVKTASCTAAGACSVSECNAENHLNDAKNGCVANSTTSCGAVNATGKTCMSTGVKTASCTTAGACSVSECNSGYHLNDAKNGCTANSNTSCGAYNTTGKTCMTTGVKTATCTTAGACSVSECNSGYHLNDAKNGCVANSNTSCGAYNATGKTCMTTGVKTATCTAAGACSVSECKAGYHLNNSKNACVANSNTSCGTPTGTGKDCTATVTKVCSSSGTCVCSTNNSTVLNYDKTACVIPVCAGIPGVEEGTVITSSWYNGNAENACNPTKCNSKYTQVSQGGNGKYFACLPKSAYFDCKSLGYTYNNGTNCIGRKDGTGSNSHAYCESNYRQYITACIHKDVCCGTRNSNMTGTRDFMCTNCKASGQTCDVTNGVCK